MISTILTNGRSASLVRVLFGCALFTLGSSLRVPFYPVSFTLHTLALFYIGLRLSPKEAASSILLYLGLATAAFPVFGGVANACWFNGAAAGYLFAFPLSAYCIAFLRTRVAPSIALLMGSAIYFMAGFLWLIPLVGIKLAFVKGVLIFLPSDFCKAIAALGWMVWEERK